MCGGEGGGGVGRLVDDEAHSDVWRRRRRRWRRISGQGRS